MREPLPLEPVAGEPGLVREPLLVDVLVHAGEDAENLEGKVEKCISRRGFMRAMQRGSSDKSLLKVQKGFQAID